MSATVSSASGVMVTDEDDSSVSVVEDGGSITVRRRHTRFFGILVRTRVYVDGACVGTLRRGQERTFPVSVGEHEVVVVAGRAWMLNPRSDPMRVQVPPSVTLETHGFLLSEYKTAIILFDPVADPLPDQASVRAWWKANSGSGGNTSSS